MKAFLILLCSMGLSAFVQAAPKALGSHGLRQSEPLRYLITVNPELRYERQQNQQMTFRHPLNLSIGVRKEKFTYLLEFSQFKETSGNSVLSIDRSHAEYVGWFNYNVLPFGIWNVFGAMGAGAYQESIRTTLNGSSISDTGELQLMGGVGAGIKVLIEEHFLASLEGRLLGGQNFDPNPQGSLVFRFGVEF